MGKALPALLLAAALLPQGLAAAPAARVVGVQLAVSPEVYKSRESFEKRLEEAASAAAAQSGRRPGEHLVLIFPEHVGTFLSFAGEPGLIYSAPSRPAVTVRQILASPRFLLYHLKVSLQTLNPRIFSTYYAFGNLLRYKAPSMWRDYTEIFSALARRHKAIVVAGSISSPAPEELRVPMAPIYGLSAVFGPDGALLGLVRKVHPVLEEELFMTPSPAARLKPVPTPAGSIGVLVCSDSWYEDTYLSLRDSDLLAIPSISDGGHAAYSKRVDGVRDNHLELAEAREGHPTVLEQLMKDGAPGRLRLTRAAGAVQPLLSGRMWDLETGGPGFTVKRHGKGVKVEMVPSVAGRDTFLNFLLPAGKRLKTPS